MSYDKFYTQQITSLGIPIKASSEVALAALEKAAEIVLAMLCNDTNITKNLVSAGAEIHIIGANEQTSDLPENQHFRRSILDGLEFDDRVRGTGNIIALCGEENLLRLDSDRYARN